MALNVIIAGAGQVGSRAAEVVSQAGHNLTVIELSEERLRTLDERLDIKTVLGNCTHMRLLREIGIEDCDLMIAATSVDEVNMLGASLAKVGGAKKTIARIHHSAFFELRDSPAAEAMGIDVMICPEHQTALEIARSLRTPGSIELEDFARGRIAMQRLAVEDNTPAVEHTLAEVALPPGARVAIIERGTEVFLARADTRIQPGDVVTLLGELDRFETARKVFQKGKLRHLNVVIMGGTSMAVWLSRALKSRLFSVRLFVTDRPRAEELADKLDFLTVINADPTDAAIFAEERLGEADAFLAVDADDERNILACAQAKSLGAKTCIAVIEQLTYSHLLEHVGIDRAFSPHVVAARFISKMVDARSARSLATLADGVAEVYDVAATATSPVLGHALRNVKLPAGGMVAAIQRGDNVRVPAADDTIEQGDRLLIIAGSGIERDLSKLISGRKQ